MIIYLLGAFILSMISGAVFTPAILNYCQRKKLYDIPTERKVHSNAIPRLGGISFFPSMVLAFAICLIIISTRGGINESFSTWSLSYLAGLSIMYAVGIVDDLIGLNAKTKFTAQICAAALMPMSSLYINNLYGLFGIYEIPAMVGIPLTIFMVVFIVNAINLIDGIDGLAASISLLALGGYLIYFVHYHVFIRTYTILTAGMMGALIVFLYFNLWGSVEKNNKIFMGDSGSLSLGFTLAFLAIKCTMDVPAIWPYRDEALLVPVTLLLVPMVDVVRVTLYRLRHGKPLFDADKNHIHHKLMQAGMNQHQALLTIIAISVIMIALNSLLYPSLSITMILGIDIIMYTLFNIAINIIMKRDSAKTSKRLMVAALLLVAVSASAQDTPSTSVTYDLSSEMAVGTGDHTAYQLTANRHHTLATRPNTGYARAAVEAEHPLSDKWMLAGGVDIIASVHADHKAYLQQLYASLKYDKFFFEIGSREHNAILRNAQLSSGAFAKGTNAKPIPQVRLGTTDFWTVPYTKGWLQIHFEGGYGKFLDNGYREDVFMNNGLINNHYSTGAWYHQKHLYFRTNPEKRFFVTAGIEHVALFGGKSFERTADGMTVKEKSVGLKDFFKVILPVGDKNYYENDAMEDWVFGNHLGSMTIQVGWNINKNHLVQVYLDDPFEDGSGMRKGNGWDGLWGVEYTNKTPGRQWVRGAVVEYFQTTNQSGPLHYDRGDYPEPIRSQITELVTGDDDYYNHMYYVSYSHYGMTLGNPLITSPIFNADGYNGFRDNRVRAWHAAVNGEITDNISYLVKGSYREGKGTYKAPIYPKRHSFDAMLQGTYTKGPWQMSAAWAFDKGNVFGDCSTFNLKINYHGKIL